MKYGRELMIAGALCGASSIALLLFHEDVASGLTPWWFDYPLIAMNGLGMGMAVGILFAPDED